MHNIRRNAKSSPRLIHYVAALCLVALSPATAFAQTLDTVAAQATPLLVITFLLSVCILAISGFTLWQSHRYYLDTARLSREITATTTELHQKIVELIYNLKDFLAHESEMVRLRERRPGKPQPPLSSKNVDKIAESITETENKIKALEKTLGRLNEQLNFNFQGSDLPQKLSALSDIEYAVLLKLSQDPRFFEKHSFTSFGATPKVLDSLLSRQLITFDRDGRAEVPLEVASALKYFPPDN
ncbi:MAG: hypothetical protein Kow0099_01520 [Candidatus Abyssubacteria bacterium]